MSKGTFQERLQAALTDSERVIIVRYAADEGKDYLIQVESDTERFGILTQSVDLPVDEATPGRLIQAIEKLKAQIVNAVETITSAQQPAPEDDVPR